jgi:hypothetical protein
VVSTLSSSSRDTSAPLRTAHSAGVLCRRRCALSPRWLSRGSLTPWSEPSPGLQLCVCSLCLREARGWATQVELSFHSLRRDAWTHVYLEAAYAFTDDINLMSRAISGEEWEQNGHFTAGRIASVALWGRALPPPEVRAERERERASTLTTRGESQHPHNTRREPALSLDLSLWGQTAGQHALLGVSRFRGLESHHVESRPQGSSKIGS